jgi:hypothetical protein
MREDREAFKRRRGEDVCIRKKCKREGVRDGEGEKVCKRKVGAGGWSTEGGQPREAWAMVGAGKVPRIKNAENLAAERRGQSRQWDGRRPGGGGEVERHPRIIIGD